MEVATAGRSLGEELKALHNALADPARPVAAIVGGAKVSTKLQVLENLVTSVDILILGGGMANTFLLARGQDVGASLVEADMVDTALAIEAAAKANGCHIVLPEDFLVASEFAANVPHRVAGPGDVGEGEMILDAGPASAEAVAQSQGFSIAGGGDTLAAIDKYAVTQGVSYISTGGGAFLEFVEGKVLPAVDVLAQRGIE